MDTMADAQQTESNPTNADDFDALPATVDEKPDVYSPELPEREKRVSKLTEKGQSWFFEKSDEYVYKLRSISDNLVPLLKFNPSECSSAELTDIEQKLKECFDNYEHFSDDYLNFLSRHNTQESALEQSNHALVRRSLADRVNVAKHDIFTELRSRATKPKSKRSDTHRSSSRHSRSSGSSCSTIIDKKIKAEAAKARLKFIKKEVELKRSAAAIQADMDKLNAYKEVAVAEAELSVVKDEYESDTSGSEGGHSSLLRKYFDNDTRDTKPPLLNINAQEFVPAKSEPVLPKLDSYRAPSLRSSMRHKPPPVLPPDDSCDKHTGMSVHANTDTNNNSVKEQALQQNVFSDFARFWFKKDLITKVDPFDDKPEHYLAWKTSFKRVMTELQVEPTEELDLLVRWLGPNSSVEARNIRACHTHNPSEGCDVIWRRLEERYGAPSLVEASIRRKLDSVKRLDDRDVNGLYHLCDILNEIHALKGNGQFAELLAQFNTPVGVSPIVAKLPRRLQDKWTTRAFQYKQQHKNVHYPPLSVFLTFVTEMAAMYNDPGFVYSQTRYSGQQPSGAPRRGPVSTNKLNVSDNTSTIPSSPQILDPSKECPLHHSRHSLNDCERFRKWRLDKRRAFLRQNRVCFKCCASSDHQSAECTSHSPCKICKSTLHATAMHLYKKESKQGSSQETNAVHGGERPDVATMCTTLCGLRSSGRSCAKIVMARVFPNNRPEAAVTVYAILDEQSTHMLARPELFDELAIDTDPIPYSLESCAGQTMLTGRRALGLCIQSIDSDVSYQLPSVIECEHIPNNRTEIPTPDVAMAYSHLKPIAQELNPLRSDVGIQLLIGRDLVEVYQVLDQITGPTGSPFAQRLSLGWVVVGDVCLGGRHRPNEVSAFKTHVQKDGRGSIFEPCEGTIQVKVLGPLQREPSATSDFIGDRVFHKDRNDDKVGMSVEDREFVSIMDKDFGKNTNGNWTAPLPFKTPRLYLPNNRSQVYRRAIGLDAGLRRNPQKLKLMVEFMANIFSSGAAEEAPPISDGRECWYIPIFGVTHPKKPGKVRAMFDSSLVYQGCSLNDALLSGPNLTNSLLGILLRFRKDRFAIAGDIQQMFYRFFVNDDHRDFLRFYWYQNNDPGLRLVEYRMTVHVFGNRPSPAVATYGLRRAVQGADKDVVHFLQKDFYVDDALTSRPSASETIDLMKRTQAVLALGGNIRLHKIVSNDKQVMDAFPAADLGKDIKDLSVGDDSMLLQHSLGLAWDLRSDSFVFTSPDSVVPFTRRGILSKVNSIFDPVGFLSPVTICGKMLLREMCPTGTDWDEPLSESFRDPWLKWTQSLDELSSVRISRMFVPESLSSIQDPEFLVFSDASEKAIAAAAYVKVNDHIGFVMGKSKLAPVSGHSIPRLELCGSVLATEIGEFVSDHLSIPPSTIQYFTDSRVVLGYIRNRTRRFYTYVSNRVSRIHSVSKPDQWNYVPSNLNPSDSATRGFIADVTNSLDTWLRGPTYLRRGDLDSSSEEKDFPLVDPDEDTEVRPEPTVLKGEVTTSAMPTPILDRFSRFST